MYSYKPTLLFAFPLAELTFAQTPEINIRPFVYTTKHQIEIYSQSHR